MPDMNDDLEVSVEQVKGMLDRQEPVFLLDVRQPEEYAIARIEGAHFIPLGDLPSALPELQAVADKPIVTICHLGMRSLQAAVFLRGQGFDHARSMAGGIDAWSERIDSAIPRY